MPRRKRRPPVNWRELPDEALLRIRVRDLGLRIEGSPLQGRIDRLYAELDARGIVFHPECYLADEWFCPDRVPIIAVPFFLADPRLTRLEKKIMLEAEGGTDDSCMRLLRHEAGHTVNYAYELFKKTRWRELFGPFSARYRDNYTPLPYSKRYVTHLPDNYAQAHPDEDFAETFAVWLAGDGWRERYRGWPVIQKLQYVDRVMARIGPTPPIVTTRETPYLAGRMTSTLEKYYDRKRRGMGEDFPGYYDPGLIRLFAPAGADEAEPAGHFIRRNRRAVVNSVAAWTGERKFDIDRLLRKLIRRCNALKLVVARSDTDTAFEFGAFVTAVMKNIHRFTEDTRDQ